MTFVMRDSFLSVNRDDRVRTEYLTYTPNAELLPERIVPLNKQCRVFINDTEISYLDTTEFVRPTTYWTYTEAVPVTTGVACWGVRLQFDGTFTAGGNFAGMTSIVLWDEEGNIITGLDKSWAVSNEFNLENDTDENSNAGFCLTENVLDLDNTTQNAWPALGNFSGQISIRFPKKLSISKIGWTSDGIVGGSVFPVQNMKLLINKGDHNNTNWVEMGSNLTQAVGNAVDHTLGDPLDAADYPDTTGMTEITAATLLLTLSVPTNQYGGEIPPTISLSAAPDNLSDKVTIFRESRQDRPWVHPVLTGLAHPEQFMDYFNHIRYIVQEMCDMDDLNGAAFSLPFADRNDNDYTLNSQAHFHLNQAGNTVFSYSDIDLLTTIPGASLDDRHQIIVESGDHGDGTSTVWTELTYDAAPSTDEYSVDSSAKTITLWASQTYDLRIRRQTRTDKWWYDPTGGQPGWNSMAIHAMQRQARFMLEEACYLPEMYSDSPLSNSIFPRGWNWFRFVGTRDRWTLGGPGWGGGGEVKIILNDLILDPGDDYDLEWPEIRWNIPEPGDGDTTDIGSGGGRWDNPLDPDDPDPDYEFVGPPHLNNLPTPRTSWPGFGGADEAHTIDISTVNSDDEPFIESPFSFSGSSAFGTDMFPDASGPEDYIYFRAEVTRKVDSVRSIAYFASWCGDTIYTLYRAEDTNGDGVLDSSGVSSNGLGCLAPGGAGGGLLSEVAATTRSSSSSPQLLLLADLANYKEGQNAGHTIHYLSQVRELATLSIAAKAAGVVANSGFTNQQFQDYLDPDVDFTDFDIPLP